MAYQLAFTWRRSKPVLHCHEIKERCSKYVVWILEWWNLWYGNRNFQLEVEKNWTGLLTSLFLFPFFCYLQRSNDNTKKYY